MADTRNEPRPADAAVTARVMAERVRRLRSMARTRRLDAESFAFTQDEVLSGELHDLVPIAPRRSGFKRLLGLAYLVLIPAGLAVVGMFAGQAFGDNAAGFVMGLGLGAVISYLLYPRLAAKQA